MNKLHLIAVFSIFLILGSTFSYGLTSLHSFYYEGEEDPNDLGEILLVNVEKYEPTTISADYIRNRNFPVYVHLTGTTLEGALFGSESGNLETAFGDLKIRDFRIIRQSLSRDVSGVQEVEPAGGYYVDKNGFVDLGYLKLYLKRQPIESELPDEIEVNLTARVEFDTESSFGVLGRQSIYFNEFNRRSFWEGRGELELVSVSGNRAKFQLYDSSGVKTGSEFDLTVNGNPYVTTIREGPYIFDSRMRVRLDGIYGNENVAVFSDGSNEFRVVKGMNLYPGSKWNVKTVTGSAVILSHEDTGKELSFELSKSQTPNLVTYESVCDVDLIGRANLNEDGRAGPPLPSQTFEEFLKENNYDIGLAALSGIGAEELYEAIGEGDLDLEALDKVSYSTDEKAKRYFCSAIQEYEEALGFFAGEERNEILSKLGDLYSLVGDNGLANEAYNRVSRSSEVYERDHIEQKVIITGRALDEGRTDYEFIEGRKIFLDNIERPSQQSLATIKIDSVEQTVQVGQKIGEDGYYNKRKFNWVVSDIQPGSIIVQMVGEGVPTTPTFDLIEGKLNPLTLNNEDGDSIIVEVEYIRSSTSVAVSVLPGDGRNYGISHFTLHFPIEKSLIQWTPDQIDSMIDSTHNAVLKLDSIIDKLSKFITAFKVACFSVFSYLAVKNAFFSNNEGRADVVQLYSTKVCPDRVISGSYKTTEECMEKEADNIEATIKVVSDAKKKANDLVKNFNVEDESQMTKISNELSFRDVNDFKNMVAYSDYTGLTPNKIQDLLTKKYIDYNNLPANSPYATEYDINTEIKSMQEIVPKLNGALSEVDKNGANLNEDLRKSILDYTFYEDDYKAPSTVEGDENVISILSGRNYLINNIVTVDPVKSGDKEVAYYVDKATGEKKLVDLEPITIGDEQAKLNGGHPLYTDSGGKNVYYGLKSKEAQYGTSYAIDEDKKVQYDDQNRVWVFPYRGRRGLYDHFGEANYVVVIYNDDGSRDYAMYNVGVNGKVELGLEGNGDDQPVIFPKEKVVPIDNTDKTPNYALIINDIDNQYRLFSKYRFISEGAVVEGYQQSKVLSGLIYNPQTECINHMSKGDCDLLFGVCDPVMCPASRFDLGGKWKVDNVVQSGIIGSIVLGLPNFGPKEPLPICLTGINAGLENIRSSFEGFEDCLQKAKASGESVGICNTVRSVYTCEILWRESLSIFGSLGKLTDLIGSSIFNRGRGGGEYINFKKNWNALQDSVSYFTDVYATSAFASYKARNLGEFGSQICKAAIYGKVPGSGDFVGELLDPQSPPQFTGWFDELEYSSVEGGKSIYRFYYHIYAGRDEDVWYYVYLKGPGLRPFVITDPERGLVRGSIEIGSYKDVSQTVEGPSGYTQMCININGKDSCGFGKVSSAFSFNFLNDLAVADEATKDINSAEECTPDYPTLTPSLGSLVTPAEYGLTRTGVLRICSPNDPDGNATRWQRVGTCGIDDFGFNQGDCYLDTTTATLDYAKNSEALVAKLKEESINNAIEGSIEVDSAEVDYVFLDMEERKDAAIKKESITDLTALGIEYLNYVNNMPDSLSEVKNKAKAGLGDIYAEIGKIIQLDADTVRSKALQEFGSRLEEPLSDFKGEKVQGLLYLTGELDYTLYSWENDVWSKYYLHRSGGRRELANEPISQYGNVFYTGLEKVYNDIVSTFEFTGNKVKFDLVCGGETYTYNVIGSAGNLLGVDIDRLDEIEIDINDARNARLTKFEFIESDRHYYWTDGKWRLLYGDDDTTSTYTDRDNFEDGIYYIYDRIIKMRSRLDESQLQEVKVNCGDNSFKIPDNQFREVGSTEFKDRVILECVLPYFGINYGTELKKPFTSYNEFKQSFINLCESKEYETYTALEDVGNLVVYAGTNQISNGYETRNCLPADPEKFSNAIKKYSEENNIPTELLLAQAMQESGCKENAVGDNGDSNGVMQIQEATFNTYCKKGTSTGWLDSYDNIKGANNVENNIACGAKILAEHYKKNNGGLYYSCKDVRYTGWRAALRAYNGNPASGCSGDPNYVEKVWNIYLDLTKKAGELDNEYTLTCEGIDELQCNDLPNCYLKVQKSFFTLFQDKYTCVDCSTITSCEEIQRQDKCEQYECTSRAGKTCRWFNNECVEPSGTPPFN